MTQAETKIKNLEKITDEDPPVFKSWTGWYALVLAFLLFEIILFYLIDRIF